MRTMQQKTTDAFVAHAIKSTSQLKDPATTRWCSLSGGLKRWTLEYTIKGKERGGFETSMAEVGSGPLEALHELLALVPQRADDEDPPAPISLALWFPPLPEPQADGDPSVLPDEVSDEMSDEGSEVLPTMGDDA